MNDVIFTSLSSFLGDKGILSAEITTALWNLPQQFVRLPYEEGKDLLKIQRMIARNESYRSWRLVFIVGLSLHHMVSIQGRTHEKRLGFSQYCWTTVMEKDAANPEYTSKQLPGYYWMCWSVIENRPVLIPALTEILDDYKRLADYSEWVSDISLCEAVWTTCMYTGLATSVPSFQAFSHYGMFEWSHSEGMKFLEAEQQRNKKADY